MRKIMNTVKSRSVIAANSLVLILAVFALLLVGCSGSSSASSGSISEEKETYTNTSATIENEENVFAKKLVPLDLEPGEEVDSLYYKFAMEDGDACYTVQPKDEELMKVPVNSSVIYLVNDPEGCKIEKVEFDFTLDGGETEHVEQYRIYSLVQSSKITVTGDGNAAEGPTAELNA